MIVHLIVNLFDRSALKIEVQSLEVRYTSIDENFLASETLLNQRIFHKITSLEIIASQIDRIDEITLLKLVHLRSFKLIYVNIDNILKHGLSWMRGLNPHFDLDVAIIADNLTLDDAFKFYLTVENLPIHEEDICLFKDYPHSQFVLPLLLYSSLDSFPSILPCTCLIYWLYRDYPIYSHLFANLSIVDQDFVRYIPYHCLNINSILYEEQIDYCQNRFQDQCEAGAIKNSTTQQISRFDSSTITALPPVISCLDVLDSISIYCHCSFESVINYLECSNSSINQLPSSFASQFDWDFVSFVGSSISVLQSNSFRYLRLKQNATLVVSNIVEFNTDIFSTSIIYDRQFRFIVQNSSLLSLAGSFVFRETNFSELIFQNCDFDLVTIGAFDGTFIQKLIFEGADSKSMSPFFKV